MLEFNTKDLGCSGKYKRFCYISTYPTLENSKKLISANRTYDCREYFIEEYRHQIAIKDTKHIAIKRANALLTLGPYSKKEFSSRNTTLKLDSQKSLFIINSFEKAHKWPLTKLYPVVSSTKELIPLIFFSGSRKWTMSPYLLSIWTLCIRLGRNKWLPNKITTLNHEELVKALWERAEGALVGDREVDSSQIYATIRKWDEFLELYPKLFSTNSRKYHWNSKHLTRGFSRPEGILRLISGQTQHRKLYRKWCELKKQITE